MPRGNIQNLIPNEERTPEQRRANASKAGKASGVVRQKKRQLKELSNIILENKITDRKAIADLKKRFPELEIEDISYGLALLLKQYEKAKNGDSKAFELLRDTAGQKPVEQQQIGFLEGDNIEIRIDGEPLE